MSESLFISGKKRKLLLIVLVVLQFIFLCGLAASYYAIDVFGEEIILETAPIDPRDIFYGDYVILNYEISRISQHQITGDANEARGADIYAVLQPSQDGVYELKQAYLDHKPEAAPGEVILKGRVDYPFFNGVHVKYGLERYYVPEGTGKEIEEAREGMKVKISVAPWGKAKIKELILPQAG